jgi:hypothetical protein
MTNPLPPPKKRILTVKIPIFVLAIFFPFHFVDGGTSMDQFGGGDDDGDDNGNDVDVAEDVMILVG